MKRYQMKHTMKQALRILVGGEKFEEVVDILERCMRSAMEHNEETSFVYKFNTGQTGRELSVELKLEDFYVVETLELNKWYSREKWNDNPDGHILVECLPPSREGAGDDYRKYRIFDRASGYYRILSDEAIAFKFISEYEGD